MKTGGKKERRSQKDKRKSDRLKGKRPAKGQGTKSKDLKTVLDSARENQKDQGAAGLAGAGRGGTIPSKKDKAKRPGRKQKHKKNLKDASQHEADEASSCLDKRSSMTKTEKHLLDHLEKTKGRRPYHFIFGQVRPGQGRHTKLRDGGKRLMDAAKKLEQKGLVSLKKEVVNDDGETYVDVFVSLRPGAKLASAEQTLRKRVIKYAFDNPKHRDVLLPLLTDETKTASRADAIRKQNPEWYRASEAKVMETLRLFHTSFRKTRSSRDLVNLRNAAEESIKTAKHMGLSGRDLDVLTHMLSMADEAIHLAKSGVDVPSAVQAVGELDDQLTQAIMRGKMREDALPRFASSLGRSLREMAATARKYPQNSDWPAQLVQLADLAGKEIERGNRPSVKKLLPKLARFPQFSSMYNEVSNWVDFGKTASRKVEASQYQSVPAKDVKVGDVVLLDANMMRSSRPTTVISVTVRSRTVGIEHVARPGQSKPFYVALEKNDPVDVRRG